MHTELQKKWFFIRCQQIMVNIKRKAVCRFTCNTVCISAALELNEQNKWKNIYDNKILWKIYFLVFGFLNFL